MKSPKKGSSAATAADIVETLDICATLLKAGAHPISVQRQLHALKGEVWKLRHKARAEGRDKANVKANH